MFKNVVWSDMIVFLMDNLFNGSVLSIKNMIYMFFLIYFCINPKKNIITLLNIY
jgi:hypothetical protein